MQSASRASEIPHGVQVRQEEYRQLLTRVQDGSFLRLFAPSEARLIQINFSDSRSRTIVMTSGVGGRER